MADLPPNQLPEGDQWLANSLGEALRMSLEAMTSETPSIAWQPIPSGAWPEGAGEWLWWEQPLTAGAGAIAWVAAAAPASDEIGKRALLAAGIDDATPEDCQSTWKEILGQTLSGLAQSLGRRLRREVTCDGGRDSGGASPAVPWRALFQVQFGQDAPFQLGFAWSEGLHAVLQPAEPEASPARKASGANEAPAAGAPRPATSQGNSRTLDLLLEVELPVSVSFGRAQLALKDVLKLNSGSIVELNRAVSEPVELIVNNCVIARGEVVVVEGNYGVRIKHIVSREERLRTLY